MFEYFVIFRRKNKSYVISYAVNIQKVKIDFSKAIYGIERKLEDLVRLSGGLAHSRNQYLFSHFLSKSIKDSNVITFRDAFFSFVNRLRFDLSACLTKYLAMVMWCKF